MTDSLQQISLLYELSVTTLKHLNPSETAENFIKKFLSRKNLSYGAIWLIEKADEEKIYLSRLYSMPATDESVSANLTQFAEAFGQNVFAQLQESLFDQIQTTGHYLYFKLGEIAVIEFLLQVLI